MVYAYRSYPPGLVQCVVTFEPNSMYEKMRHDDSDSDQNVDSRTQKDSKKKEKKEENASTENRYVGEVIKAQFGPAIGAHAGPGAVGVAFIGDAPEQIFKL